LPDAVVLRAEAHLSASPFAPREEPDLPLEDLEEFDEGFLRELALAGFVGELLVDFLRELVLAGFVGELLADFLRELARAGFVGELLADFLRELALAVAAFGDRFAALPRFVPRLSAAVGERLVALFFLSADGSLLSVPSGAFCVFSATPCPGCAAAWVASPVPWSMPCPAWFAAPLTP
jgi:hypothetical protein